MQRSSLLLSARVAATSALLRNPTAKSVAFADTIAEYDAVGADVAGTSTKEFLKLQSLLIPYRIVRLNDELKAARELGFGALPAFKDLPVRIAILFIFYFVGIVCGRRSLFSSSSPELTPEQIAEKKKAEEEAQLKLNSLSAEEEAKRAAQLELQREAEERNRASIEAAAKFIEERRAAMKALAEAERTQTA